ncbi:MAG: electron transport complex subunit E [Oscillospiraceae bacterium]|jgi:electron transport complex protein RnfE|nr:electron transport complex subunit E [Oscillospiraceae bacterium]MCI9393955.1 electron transport complex subunit E [Oscillospiraceae bacterium]MCI9581100.1 electron transport complex subunit E [Oscillospiraceae bacterium]
MSNENSKLKILTNGILAENPVLRLVLGTCPTLAVTTMASNGIGMGLAATFVLLCSNVVISALRKIIPDQVRIPAYISVIAGFVSVVQMLVKAFVPSLDASLGVYLPLIVVNCIILGRAEMFASKNNVLDSALDGIGMGIGFTITLTIMGSIREILGAGTWMAGLDGLLPFLPAGFKIQILPASIDPFSLMTSAPGGFFVYGILMAAAVYLTTPKAPKAAKTAEGGEA